MRYPTHNTHIPYKHKATHRTQKVLGEQAAWRPEASAANPMLPADPTGRIRGTPCELAETEHVNIIIIICEAKTGGGDGAPTTCYIIYR